MRDFGAACDGTTDDSVALATAAAALANTGTSLHIPGNCRIRMGGAAQVWLRGLHVVGDATFEPGVPGSPSRYGQQGSTVLITDATKSPFLVSSGWAMSGLIFNWPAQTEAASVANSGRPIVFPPLITNHGADQATFWSFDDNQVENAYDIIDLANAGGVGHFHFTHNLVFALRYHFVLKSAGGESFVTDNQFSPAAYEYEVLGYQTTHLRDFAAANAEILHIIGDGTPRAVARTAVEGMRLSGNYAFVLRYGIHAAGGTFGIGALVADSFDQVQTVIGVDSGGLIDATTVTGGTWLCQRLGNRAAAAPCVDIDGGAPGNSLTLANVQVPVAAGAGIRFNDTWTPALSNLPPFLTIIGGSILNVGETTTGNAYSGVSFNAPQGILTLSGTTITTKAGANALGVVVDGAKASVMSGVTLGGFHSPVAYNTTSGLHSITGSSSYASTAPPSAPAITGSGAGLVVQAGNHWDIGPQAVSMVAPPGQSDTLECRSADASADCNINVQAGGRMVIGSSTLGTVGLIGPSGSRPQIAYPIIQSAPAGGSVGFSASSGNVTYTAPKYVLIPTANLPPCLTGPAGYLCAAGTSVGSAVQVK